MKKTFSTGLLLSLLLLLFSFEGCFLFPDSNSKEILPPATQTGAGTFGFLLNGQVWLPKGNNGTLNLAPYYGIVDNSPVFNINSYRIISDLNRQYFALGINGIKNEGIYVISRDSIVGSFSNSTCDYYWNDSTVYQKGQITITKLALPIISGTFDFKLYKPGCDTIKITRGRFDFKFQ